MNEAQIDFIQNAKKLSREDAITYLEVCEKIINLAKLLGWNRDEVSAYLKDNLGVTAICELDIEELIFLLFKLENLWEKKLHGI